MNPIEKPFNLDIDVCGETPVSDIPDSYMAKFKERLLTQQAFLNAVAKFNTDTKCAIFFY
jgi:hypothetical protein